MLLEAGNCKRIIRLGCLQDFHNKYRVATVSKPGLAEKNVSMRGKPLGISAGKCLRFAFQTRASSVALRFQINTV